MANITNAQMQVLIKVIGAVETGGQIYGQARYDAYIGAGHNTTNETSITIGAFQEYHWHAKALLQEILDTYPNVFRKYDIALIESDLKRNSWEGYSPASNSTKASTIKKIIATPEGKKIQDIRIERLLKEYIAFAEKQGVSDVDALFMCANFIHQGGQSACTRILKKAPKPYTLDNLYNACKSDTGNQVGAYKTRQQKVYGWLKEKINNIPGGNAVTVTKEQAISKMINVATAEIGYLEKASNSQLDSKTGNAGYNNYTKYWRDLYPQYQAQPWCAIFVSWVLMKAFGIEVAKKLLKHWPYVYCPTLGNLFTRHANPEVGDIVIFYRNGTFVHTGIVIRVNGDKFWTIEGNTSGGSAIVDNAGSVCQKSYYNSQLPGTKFCRPDWSLVTSINGSVPGNSVSSPATTYAKPWVGRCTGDEVNVRTGAGTSYQNAAWPKLNKGNKVDVLGETGSWYYVNIQGNKGYIIKAYITEIKSSSSGNSPAPSKSNKVIKNGQIHANNFAGAGVVADGIRGSATMKAARKVLQQGLNLDYRAGLEIDGEIGALTKRTLGSHYVEYGEKQYMVTALEILLMLKGYEVNGVESPGAYGAGLKSAVKKWGSDNGVSVNSNGRITASMFLKLVQ